MRPMIVKGPALVLVALAVIAAGPATQRSLSTATAKAGALPARIWEDRGAIATLDLVYGAGGPAHAPTANSTFSFVKEDAAGTNPKFDVVDEAGVEWKVKLGPESQPETAATRLLWAVGYFTDEDYYVADLVVKGLPTLTRGADLVSRDGVIHGARLERKLPADAKHGDWDWFDNPFIGTRELNGLRVMMSFLNSWDLKQVNNAVYVVNDQRHYLVSDAGATFGKTGNAITRTRNAPKDFEDSKFIDKVTPETVDFVLHSRPIFLGAVAVPNYVERTKMEAITKHIPRADVRWLAQRLSQLTESQIRDAFRTAGYGAADVSVLTSTLQRRIAEMSQL